MTCRRLAIAAAALLVGTAPGCKRGPATRGNDARAAARPRPNVVFVMIDTLRADRLGVYGHRGSLTPNLDAIAGDGVLFERTIAQAPWTQPSIASLFCGVYPGVHQVTDYRQALAVELGQLPKIRVLGESFQTLAEVLRADGYVTAGFVANPYVLGEFGFSQGFERYDTSFADNTASGRVLNDAAIAWLGQRDPKRPFFVYLHYMDVHGPYEAPAEYLESLLEQVETLPEKHELSPEELARLRYLRTFPASYPDLERHQRLSHYREYWVARYEAGVREMDAHIGDLRARLKAIGLWDDLCLIITSDHGEALCERGFWDHGNSAFHMELHVPLLLRWPARLPVGTRVARTVRLIDLLPTLVDQLGLPEGPRVQGASLVPDLQGKRPSHPVPALAEAVKLTPEEKALYIGGWKLMVNVRTSERLLYNVAEDPEEHVDLSADSPDRVALLEEILEEQVERNRLWGSGLSAEDATLTPEQAERLRSLGYLQ